MTGTHSIPRRTFLAAALASAAAAAATSCGFSGGDEPSTPAKSTPTTSNAAGGSSAGAATETPSGSAAGSSASASALPKGGTLTQSMLPVPHLDPAMNGSISARGNLLQSGLLEGLVLRDPEDGGKVLPGVSEKWSVSDDGLVYTFTLRADAVWSNGDPVTAEDFVWNWKRSLAPDTTKGTEYKPSANGVMKRVVGAAEFFGGKTDDFSTVGVKATDKTTLEITLTAPDPMFLPLMAEWRTLPLHPKTVEAHPKDWADPKNWVGNGAYVLTAWRANAGCTLKRSDSYWDAASYAIDTWEAKFNDGGDTAQMLSYQADELDLFMVEGDPAAIVADPELAKQLITAAPTQFKCLTVLPSENPILEDVRIRKALSLAIDRETLAKVAMPDAPGFSLVPEGIVDYDKIPQTKFDPEQAKSLLADAGYPGGKGIPTINLLLRTPTPWVEAVGGMWKEHLGIQTAIDLVELSVLKTKRKSVQPKDYVGFWQGYYGLTPPTMYKAASWGKAALGRYAIPGSAAKEYVKVDSDENLAPADKAAQLKKIQQDNWFPEFAKYMDLTDQAGAAAADPAKLRELAIQACTAREEAYVALPVLWAGYSFMIKPRVHDLVLTSYPDRVFTLSGVTLAE